MVSSPVEIVLKKAVISFEKRNIRYIINSKEINIRARRFSSETVRVSNLKSDANKFL